MSVGKLKVLFKDIEFSFKFAQTHLNMGMPSLMRSHAHRHRSDIDLIRQTDTDAGRLARFRDSIRNNHTDAHDSGTDDYTHMVDIIMRRSGVLDAYAGPRDVADWLKLKDLKGQFRSLMDSQGILGEHGALKHASELWNNPGFVASRSVAKTAYKSAVSELQESLANGVTADIGDALVSTIVEEYNSASAEVGGPQMTVADLKKDLGDIGDGVGSGPSLTVGADGWN
ncbi:MAG: hypothetical protein QM572_14985 [Nocardioides sp.]|uniref:hypothetical protein n=1 Tax=Nocardioides sp. TaxID=35761 RepID=UPI0039E21DE7